MSERIADLFARTKQEDRAALLPYLVLGYPDQETSLAAARAALDAGADGMELGIPFSDPLADGPTIQQAGDEALRQGMTLRHGLALIARLRGEYPEPPLFLMSYLNPLLAYGLDSLCRDAAAAGVDGLIVPDLPLEEEGQLVAACETHRLTIIHLLAPTSSPTRIAQIAAQSEGMLYLVSVSGVTGARAELPRELPDFVQRVRRATDLPLAVGFGISTPAQARAVGQFADGIIVGSELVRRLRTESVGGVSAFVRLLSEALRDRKLHSL
jgi:tryptophan synthase alpha chain